MFLFCLNFSPQNQATFCTKLLALLANLHGGPPWRTNIPRYLVNRDKLLPICMFNI